MRLIKAIAVVCFVGMVAVAVRAQYIDHIGGPCVPQPYKANAWNWENFTPEQQAELKAYTDYLERAMFEEIYLRFCWLRDNDKSGDCNIWRTDTIQACTWPDECDISDPYFGDGYGEEHPTVTINTGVLELLAKPIDDQHRTGSCQPYSTEKLLEAPYLRWRGGGGDSLSLSFIGSLDSTATLSHIMYWLPDDARYGKTMWVFNTGGCYEEGSNRPEYIGSVFPYTGMCQGGKVSNINTNATRDTIVFATSYSHTHGGDSEDGAYCMYRQGGSAAREYHAGYKYNISNIDYSVVVQWGSGSSGYFGDSLWVESKTDSSFVIGIQYSGTSRSLHWQTFGSY